MHKNRTKMYKYTLFFYKYLQKSINIFLYKDKRLDKYIELWDN